MLLTQLNPRHTKDEGLVSIANLYITADRMLMVHGPCTKCGELVDIAISFNELEINVPTNTQEFTEADKHIAHSLGISLEDPCPLS